MNAKYSLVVLSDMSEWGLAKIVELLTDIPQERGASPRTLINQIMISFVFFWVWAPSEFLTVCKPMIGMFTCYGGAQLRHILRR
ncbi:Uncharacterized protein HZ326_7784 [Fusarium oxysporum f. sp. albedinis]|nr:Uncharacterized protein HZ326_7784 [Fusarium oxysporum f. sp. albedinis]